MLADTCSSPASASHEPRLSDRRNRDHDVLVQCDSLVSLRDRYDRLGRSPAEGYPPYSVEGRIAPSRIPWVTVVGVVGRCWSVVLGSQRENEVLGDRQDDDNGET